ncbi:RHS repeat-associated core domain-containing protein [Gilliamella apicola]|uniref:RHS repeat-associated core domain-containing protein n=1 Tax=Gilliamella sp. App6-5 TaxID=3120232 RepID=UPI0009BDE0AE
MEHQSIEQNLRYQGQYLHRKTGLHCNTFRYYHPDIGRFTLPSPIGLQMTRICTSMQLSRLDLGDPCGKLFKNSFVNKRK